MIKTEGMVKILLVVGMIVVMLLMFSCSKSVSQESAWRNTPLNKPIEIRLNNSTRITFDLDQADVTFYTGKEKNIQITYEPKAFETVPDYSSLAPDVKTVKKELHISMQSPDHHPHINIYIPPTVEQITILHEKGTLLFNDDITAQLTVKGNKSDIKVNYIQSLLNINVSEGNVSIMKGILPQGSNITVEVGNINVCADLEDGEYLFSTEYGNIDFRSNTKGVNLSAIGYTRLNDFPGYQAGATSVTLDSKVGFISASGEY
ncbi:MAG TPA: hypothetical protein DDZ89_00175 [Clostridiales bacterium]|nr:hypothetical protein [Clostridiales bacterium]